MKLRIKDNSLRFRLLRGEVEVLKQSGRIEAHTLFGAAGGADRLSYVLESSNDSSEIKATHSGQEIRVAVPGDEIFRWANGNSVGIYGQQFVYGGQVLEIAIEKDFACIDGSDADNTGTFDNPNASAC